MKTTKFIYYLAIAVIVSLLFNEPIKKLTFFEGVIINFLVFILYEVLNRNDANKD